MTTVHEAQRRLTELQRESEELAEADLEMRRRTLPNRLLRAVVDLHRARKGEETAAALERLKGDR